MTPTDTRRPTWRQWCALLLLGLPMFMMATDFTAIFLAVPPVAADLEPTATQLLWIVHIGELVAAGTLITMGWLTGRIGPRTLLLLAVTLYGIGSALAAFSPTAEAFLTARVLIGAATAAASPAAFAMLRWLFTSAQHYSVGFAVVMGAFPVGSALGPPLTGLLLEHFWWGSVFLINVPVAAAAALGGLWLFPGESERTTDRIDITSVVVSMAAVMLIVFGLQEIADQGVSVTYALSVGSGVVLGWWFIRRQRRIDNPLVDLGLFASRVLRILMAFFLLSPVAFMAADFILIQHLQIVAGISTGTLGLVLAVPGIASIAATSLTPVLAARFTPATVMTVGTGTGVLGLLVILTAVMAHPVTWLFAIGMTTAALGAGPSMVLGAQLVLTSVSKMQTGPVAALQDISASLGSALGIMVLGSLSMSVFRRTVNADAPDAVSEAELNAGTDSPGAAAAMADEMGGSTGEQLLSVVHDAWTWGTVATYAAAVLIGVLIMLVVGRGLRGIRLPSDDATENQAADPPSAIGEASGVASTGTAPSAGGPGSSGGTGVPRRTSIHG